MLLVLTSWLSASAFNPTPTTPLKYVDANQFPVINRGFNDTVPKYTRVPDSMRELCLDEIWRGAQDACGVGIRFRTDSKSIGVRYNLKYDFGMTWQAYTGIKGTDLYVLGDDNRWHHLNSSRPIKDSVQEKCYTLTLDGIMREYLIYLPLYDGVNWMQIGVDSSAYIGCPAIENPKLHQRIVFYGTSVMQGGCASRTGMTQTAILQRDLGVECVNFGISGNARIYPQTAKLLAAMDDVICYVIDPLQNNTKQFIDSLSLDFIRTLHEAHPQTPIIMVESENEPPQAFDTHLRDFNPKRNASWHAAYEQLKAEFMAEGNDVLYYQFDEGFAGKNLDGSVDGAHLTDYGFQMYADCIEPLLKQILGKITYVGHRGSCVGIENTLDAFKGGVERGYQALETDIRVTKDGEYVCSHDANLKYWGQPKLVVEETKFAKLQKLTLKQTRWGKQYTGKICTFDEYLTYCKDNDIVPVIELKNSKGLYGEDLSKMPGLVEKVKAHGLMETAIFISFNKSPLQWLRDNEGPDVQLQFLCTASSECGNFEWMKANNIGLDIMYGFSEQLVDKYHQAGLTVNCWTIDKPELVKHALRLGVDMVTTNMVTREQVHY